MNKGKDASDVGILYNGIGPGDIMEVQAGTTVNVTVFNAAPDGEDIEFEYTWSSATGLAASVVTGLSFLYLY